MELPKENPYFHLEEQYEVAAWRSTIQSLSELWTDPHIHIEAQQIPETIRVLSQMAFKNPLEIMSYITRYAHDDYPADLMDLGLLTRNSNPSRPIGQRNMVDSSYTLMHELHFVEDTILLEIAQEAGYERFETDIARLALYNRNWLHTAITHSYSLINLTRTIQHDNLFYIGQWDTERNLRTIKN